MSKGLKVGMLWLGDEKRSLEENVTAAVAHYTRKYDRVPNTAYVSRAAMARHGQGEEHLDAFMITVQDIVLLVKRDKGVHEANVWLGVAED